MLFQFNWEVLLCFFQCRRASLHITSYSDESRKQSHASRTLFLRLLFLLCAESRDEIYFIFDFRMSFDADFELTIESDKRRRKKTAIPNRRIRVKMCIGLLDARHDLVNCKLYAGYIRRKRNGSPISNWRSMNKSIEMRWICWTRTCLINFKLNTDRHSHLKHRPTQTPMINAKIRCLPLVYCHASNENIEALENQAVCGGRGRRWQRKINRNSKIICSDEKKPKSQYWLFQLFSTPF